jgi:NAD+ kinase
MSREVLVLCHPTRAEASNFADILKKSLNTMEVDVVEEITPSTEIVIVLGGDGTMLRAAEMVFGTTTPILGINLGKVGFLAEIQNPSIEELSQAISQRSYRSEPRLVLHYSIHRDSHEVANGWSLNEVVIERSNSAMVELFVQIDHRPLSRWGCDGVICATPTGSTAYAFSAGGPVVWPEVNAITLLPLAAHALFSKPMVISSESIIGIDIESPKAEIVADGMRRFPLLAGDRVSINRSEIAINLAHIESALFTDRLVAKFKLPVEGWRGKKSK